MSTGLPHSVQVRLVNHAHKLGIDPNLVYARYAAERLLFRLSMSPHADQFVLKGALLLLVWLGETIRPTRDADLLGPGGMDADVLRRVFPELCTLDVEPDGLTFDPSSVTVAAIRRDNAHGGQRVMISARLGPVPLRVQVDVGFGDDVTPEPVWIEYPTLIGMPRPRLRAYQPETTVAEKLHAMVELGSKNSRMRDFYDVRALAANRRFDGAVLVQAVRATFGRRGTEIPREAPLALTHEFAAIEGKGQQWAAFLRKGRLTPMELTNVIDDVAGFAEPVLAAAATGDDFRRVWQPGGPWGEVHRGPATKW